MIGREIEKASQGIYPLQNVMIRKVKILKSPKFDISKLMELHGESTSEETGTKVVKEFKEVRLVFFQLWGFAVNPSFSSLATDSDSRSLSLFSRKFWPRSKLFSLEGVL